MIGILQKIAWTLIGLVGMDLVIVMATMMQIAVGQSTPHIQFWDMQIRVIYQLIS